MCTSNWRVFLLNITGLLPSRPGRPTPMPTRPATPQVQELEVWEKLKNLKKTKSTFPLDLPEKIRKEFAVELTAPLVDIYNSCLNQGVFPTIWKEELLVPVPKKEILKEIKETRNIACLSDFSKIYEGFLRTWILEDLSENERFSQFGGKSGVGANTTGKTHTTDKIN